MLCNTIAVPSSMAVCMSWPQACITPGFWLAQVTLLSSVMGSASKSARIPRPVYFPEGAGPLPGTVPTTAFSGVTL